MPQENPNPENLSCLSIPSNICMLDLQKASCHASKKAEKQKRERGMNVKVWYYFVTEREGNAKSKKKWRKRR